MTEPLPHTRSIQEAFDDDRAIADALAKARAVALARRRLAAALASEFEETKEASRKRG